MRSAEVAPGDRLPSWRVATAMVLFCLAAELWLLMIIRSRDALFFEPTSSATERAANSSGPVRGLAIGCVVAVVLLAWTARRLVLLALAVPAALMLLVPLVHPAAASVIIGLIATALVGAWCVCQLLVVRLARPDQPTMIKFAAVLATAYAVILCALVALLLGEQLTGQGRLGRLQLSGSSLRGLIVTLAGLTCLAVSLSVGAARLGSARSGRMITVPLLGLLIIGTIGETADVAGGHTTSTSNWIGAGLLVMIVLPVLLLRARSSRTYLTARPPAGRHP